MTTWCGTAADGLQPYRRQAVEQSLPAPDDRRDDHEPELVHDVGSKQRPSERDAAVDADVAARPSLQLPDEVDQSALDHARAGPLAFERRRCCDVLGNGVDERGER